MDGWLEKVQVLVSNKWQRGKSTTAPTIFKQIGYGKNLYRYLPIHFLLQVLIAMFIWSTDLSPLLFATYMPTCKLLKSHNYGNLGVKKVRYFIY